MNEQSKKQKNKNQNKTNDISLCVADRKAKINSCARGLAFYLFLFLQTEFIDIKHT